MKPNTRVALLTCALILVSVSRGESLPDQIETLKRAVPMEAVVAACGIDLRDEGANLVGLCPFHSERTASFKVKKGEPFAKCFGCAWSGDQLDFLQKFFGIETAEAIVRLREMAGASRVDKSWERSREVFRPAMAQPGRVAKTYPLESWQEATERLWGWQGVEGKEFLRGRGISRETAERFCLGFIVNGERLVGPPGRAAEEDERERRLRLRSTSWLGIPYLKGDRITLIKWRAVRELSEGLPRYLTETGMSAEALWNEEGIDPLDAVYLTEGELDAITLEQAGFRACSVHSASKKLSPSMKDALLKAEKVFIAGDNEKSGVGLAAMERLLRDLGERAHALLWPRAESEAKKDANGFFLGDCQGDSGFFRRRVLALSAEAERPSSPHFEAVEMILQRLKSGVKPEDDPARLRFPWQQLDGTLLVRPQNYLVVTSSHTGQGKCVAEDSHLVDFNTGSLREGRQSVPLLTAAIGPRGDSGSTQVVGFQDCGEKAAIEITMASGRRIIVTPEHPLLTFDGWRRCEQLAVRDSIAVPARIRYKPSAFITAEEARLLGYLLGDGTVSGSGARFYNADREIIVDCERCVKMLFPGYTFATCGKYGYHIAGAKSNNKSRSSEQIGNWLASCGVGRWRAWDKRVPEIIFRVAPDIVAEFLKAFFSCDGGRQNFASPSKANKRFVPWVSCSSSSERMIRDLQHLLLRLGIISNLKEVYRRERCYYTLSVASLDALNRYYSHIGFIGRKNLVGLKLYINKGYGNASKLPPEAKAHARRLWKAHRLPGRPPSVRGGIRRNLALRLAKVCGDERLRCASHPDILWDSIIAMRPCGKRRFIDLQTTGGSFVANDIYVHNSTFTSQITLHNALERRAVVVIYSPDTLPDDYGPMIAAQLLVRSRQGLAPEDYQRAIETLAGAEIYVGYDPDANTPQKIFDLCEQAIRRLGADIFVLDTAYSVILRSRFGERTQAAEALALWTKDIAVKYGIVPIVLAQTRKKPPQEGKNRWAESDDTAYAKALATEATAHIEIHRDPVRQPKAGQELDGEDYQNEFSPETLVRILKARRRLGRGSVFRFWFDGDKARFLPMAPPSAVEERGEPPLEES